MMMIVIVVVVVAILLLLSVIIIYDVLMEAEERKLHNQIPQPALPGLHGTGPQSNTASLA